MTIAEQPTLDNINPKYNAAIQLLLQWSKALVSCYGGTYFGFYIRGSVAHGCDTKGSDLDTVLLVNSITPEDSLRLKQVLKLLVANYFFSYLIGIKVFNVVDDTIEPPLPLDHSNYSTFKKHVNFDVFANGICVDGEHLHDQSSIFKSVADFKDISTEIWGDEILTGVEQIKKSGAANDYDGLIKRCIRYATYHHFNDNDIYYGTKHGCFLHAQEKNLPELELLKFLYQTPTSSNWNKDKIETVNQAILQLSNQWFHQNDSH